LNTNLGVYNGVGKIKIGRRIHNLFRTGAYSNLVERTLLVILVVLAAAIVLSAGFVAFRFTPQVGAPGSHSPPIGVAFDVTHVGGTPGMNTTDFWVARITHVDTNETLTSYRATLLRNGSVLVEPTTVKPGQLGGSSHPVFAFFEWGVYCSPTPCPSPDGPDGNLSVNDYFRISYPDPGTEYTVRVIWAETGDVVGEIVIRT